MKSITSVTIILLVSLSLALNAQVTFQKNFGISLKEYFGKDAIQTFDGGYIAGGYISDNNFDYILIKTDANGDTSWTRSYNGINQAILSRVIQTSDSGFIISGSDCPGGNSLPCSIYIIKTDALGNVVWSKDYDAKPPMGDAYPVICRQLNTGEFIIATTANALASPPGYKNLILVKTDVIGDTIWTERFDESVHQNYTSLLDFRITYDGGFIIYGSNEIGDFLLKTDSNGLLSWSKQFSVSTNFSSVQQANDGGYIFAALKSSMPNFGIYVVKTDSMGNVSWAKSYGTNDGCYSLQKTNDGGYILTGFIIENQIEKTLLIKTNSAGDTLWTRSYDGRNGQLGVSVVQVNDDGFLLSGYAYDTSGPGPPSQILLVKTDSLGHTGCYESQPSISITNINFPDSVSNFIVSSGCDVSSHTVPVSSGDEIFSSCISTNISEPPTFESILIVPNPSPGIFSIESSATINNGMISIFDIPGKIVFEEKISQMKKHEIDLSDFQPGIYFFRLVDGENQFIRKIVIQ